MTLKADKLMQVLVKLSVASAECDVRQELHSVMKGAEPVDWTRCLVRLDEHRLLPLVHFGLTRVDCLGLVPKDFELALRSHFDYSRAWNIVRWVSLQGLVRRLQRERVVPTVCKGLVLAQRYYPEPATRYMNDIDLWIDDRALESTRRVLSDMGFEWMPEKELPDGGCYRNPLGLVVDLHHRMQLFEGLVEYPFGFKEEYEPGGFLVHEPHALLAHLFAHLVDHFSETGPMLCWLLDIGYVLERDGRRLDPERLQRLIAQVASWPGFLGALRLLDESFSMAIPADLLRAARAVAPLRLETVLRQRRLSLWGLPRPKGWLRLMMSVLRPSQAGDRPRPTPRDLLVWPRDLVDEAIRHTVARDQ